MIRQYIHAAMKKAKYEIFEDDQSFYGEIPECRGVWANADTLEACRDELESALESWLLFSISRQFPVPIVDGIDLSIREPV